jgi:excisionase family DNA binding protein
MDSDRNNLRRQKVLKDALNQLQEQPTIRLHPETSAIIGVGKNKVYQLADSGEIETVRFGSHRRAITSSLRKRLGL